MELPQRSVVDFQRPVVWSNAVTAPARSVSWYSFIPDSRPHGPSQLRRTRGGPDGAVLGVFVLAAVRRVVVEPLRLDVDGIGDEDLVERVGPALADGLGDG